MKRFTVRQSWAPVIAAGVLATLFSADVSALSCSAGGDNCRPWQGDLYAHDEGSIIEPSLIYAYSASVDASAGTLTALASLQDNFDTGGPGAMNQQVGANLYESFTIQGPMTTAPVIMSGFFRFSGGASTNCGSAQQCSASVSYSATVMGGGASLPSFNAFFSASTSSTYPITANMVVSGSDAVGDDSVDTNAGVAAGSFSVSVRPGYALTLDTSLGASVAFGSTAPVNAFALAEGNHTALFNFVLPEGYSLVATPGFLSNPALFVPLPGTVWLLASAFGIASFRMRKLR